MPRKRAVLRHPVVLSSVTRQRRGGQSRNLYSMERPAGREEVEAAQDRTGQVIGMAREMTAEQRRETLIDTFASFALDGMLPTDADLAVALAYIAGEVTLESIIEEAVAEFRRA